MKKQNPCPSFIKTNEIQMGMGLNIGSELEVLVVFIETLSSVGGQKKAIGFFVIIAIAL